MLKKLFKKFVPSGYEMCLKRLCNLVKSRVLADIPIKIGEMVFRTFVYFFELLGGVFPQLFPKWFDTHVRNIFKLKWET